MELVGCKALCEATQGCRVVILVATETEADPLRRAFRGAETHTVATKTLVVGSLHGADASPARTGSVDKAVRAALAITGCDKSNAAHSLACLLVAMDPRPSVVVQSGVAGSFAGTGGKAGPAVGDLVFATEEIYSDTGSSTPKGWQSAADLGLPIALVQGTESGGRFVLDPALVHAAMGIVRRLEESKWPGGRPALFAGPCVTTSRITGIGSEGAAISERWGALAESMEGAAAAHVCALHGVPFLEIRGISNPVVDRDRASWQVTQAGEVAARAALAVATSLEKLPLAAQTPGPEPHRLSGR